MEDELPDAVHMEHDMPSSPLASSKRAELRKFVSGLDSFSELASVIDSDSSEDDLEDEASPEPPNRDEPRPGTSTSDFDDVLPRSRKKRGTTRSKLDRHSQSLIGSANLAFARGNTGDAIKMCLEVIREHAKAHEVNRAV